MTDRRRFLTQMTLGGVAMTATPLLGFTNPTTGSPSKSQIKKGMVFLFQGDSITDGNRGRNNDPNHIMGHGYAFSIASRLGADFPDERFIFYNRGISGNKVADLASRWKTDTIDLKPDVLSILIGVNDVQAYFRTGADPTGSHFETTLRGLIAETRQVLPDVVIVLCEPFLLPVGKVKDDWAHWKEQIAIRQSIVRRIAEEMNCLFVSFQQTIDEACRKAPADYWIWDGIHPTVPCHELLARTWLKVVGKKLRIG